MSARRLAQTVALAAPGGVFGDCVPDVPALKTRSNLLFSLHRFDAECFHKAMFDQGRTLWRTSGRALAIDVRYDDPGAGFLQCFVKHRFKVGLRVDACDVLKTRTTGYGGEIGTKRGVRWLPAGEFKLTIVPYDVDEVFG